MPIPAYDHRPLPDLIEQSLDEAIFLWQRWEEELHSLTRNLDEICSWTEDRLHGALDGVRVGGDSMVELVSAGLTADNPHHVAVSTCVLASTPSAAAATTVLAALSTAPPDKLTAMLRGLELSGSNHVLSSAAAAFNSSHELHRAALCRLKNFRRSPPGNEMLALFKSDQPELQAHALQAIRLLPLRDVEEWVAAGLQAQHAAARYMAIDSGIRRGSAAAWRAAVEAAARLNAESADYFSCIAMLGKSEDHEIIYAALRDPKLQCAAVSALGHIGDARAVEACLHGMRYESLARFAAEAYCCITGADLERDNLATAEPTAESPAFEDDDLDANLVPAAEDLWPMPDAAAVQRHWQAQQAQFTAGTRYLRGHPLEMETLLAAVESGPMLRRPELLMQLSARTRGQYDVEPRAFAARQQRMMQDSRSALAGH